jgi:class I fructose-bisphosphate aldolase
MDWARQRRLDRLRSASGQFLLLALDHGLSLGAIEGLQDLTAWLRFVDETQMSGAVVNLGAASNLSSTFQKSLVLQMMSLPAGSPSVARKVAVGSVEVALRNGADAVSVQLWLEDPSLADSVAEVSQLTHSAHGFGLPVLLMITDSATSGSTRFDLADKLRIANELGADLIKVTLPNTLSIELRQKVTDTVAHVAPVLLAGGAATHDAEHLFLEAAALGFSGVCIGRHIFQAESPPAVLRSIALAWQSTS